MWITNEDQTKGLVLAAEVQGWDVDLWWRDEWRLAEAWRLKGWPSEPRQGYGAIECFKDVVAWIYIYGNEVWAIESIGPWDGVKDWRLWTERPNGPGMITIFNMRDMGGPPMRGPCVPGGWCGWTEGKKIHIGQPVTVTKAGQAATVRTARNSGPIPVASLNCKRVFPLVGRDEALAWFFEQGETTFSNYWALRGKLYHKQRKLTDTTPAKHRRPGPMPQGDGPAAPAQPPEPSIAEVVAALLIERDKCNAYAEECTEKRIACKEGTPEDFRWHDIEEAAWEKNAAAWDAWKAANEAWIAELLE